MNRRFCFLTTSVTYAQKGVETLRGIGLNAMMVRPDRRDGAGCGWCVTVPLSDSARARAAIEGAGIRYTDAYITGDDI